MEQEWGKIPQFSFSLKPILLHFPNISSDDKDFFAFFLERHRYCKYVHLMRAKSFMKAAHEELKRRHKERKNEGR